MPLPSNVMQGGYSAGGARAIVGAAQNAAVAGAGTTQGTATAVTADVINITSGAGNSGVILPAVTAGSVVVYNSSGQTIKVYPPTGAGIDATGTNTAVSMTTGQKAIFTYVSSTQIIMVLSA